MTIGSLEFKFGVEPEQSARLQEYVDLDKWDKETGFNAAQVYLLEKYPVIDATIILEASLEESELDSEYYKTVLSRTGTSTSKDNVIKLSDGVLAVAVLTDINILNSLYAEPKIINIIPNLSKKR